MKTLVIGLGNPILGDDGVGWHVADEIAKYTADSPNVEVDCVSLGGLSLMERLTGSNRVILIDAIFTGRKPNGTVRRISLEDLPDLTSGHSASVHDTSLRNALSIGRSMDIPLPEDKDIIVVAIETENVYDFSQELSPAVAAAVPQTVKVVMDLLDG
jgi:hydrogenase maturation protease